MSSPKERRARLKGATFGAFGEDATWLSVTDGPLSALVRREPGLSTLPFGDGRIEVETLILRVLREQVPSPAIGDQVEIDGETFRVIADPRLDPLGFDWLCEAQRI